MGLTKYKSRPEEACRLAIAACLAGGITVDVDHDVLAACCRYNSGAKTPDHDAADAFVALCTAILYCEGECRAATLGDRWSMQTEGVIWVPRIEATPPKPR